MRIYFDVDDTVFKSKELLVEYLNNYYDSTVDYTSIKDYSCKDQFPQATTEEIEHIFDDCDFYDEVKMYKGCKKLIKKLNKHHQVIFLTKGNPRNLFFKSLRLKEEFPDNQIITLSHGLDKNLIDMENSILIDDYGQYLENSLADITILFAADGRNNYNSRVYDMENHRKVKNYKELKILFREMKVM